MDLTAVLYFVYLNDRQPGGQKAYDFDQLLPDWQARSTTILFDYWEKAESSGKETNNSLDVHLEISLDASGNLLYW